MPKEGTDVDAGESTGGEGGGTPPVEGDATAAFAEALTAISETQARILEMLGKGSEGGGEPIIQVPQVKIEPPPPTPQGRITRKDYDELVQYAAEQRQRAERLSLAAEFELDEGALEGDFYDPADMRHTAEMLALRNKLTVLEQSLQGRDPTPPDEGEGEGGGGPTEDTGGPTSLQDEQMEAIKQAYDKADALGSTKDGRRARLQAIYADPSKRELVTPG